MHARVITYAGLYPEFLEGGIEWMSEVYVIHGSWSIASNFWLSTYAFALLADFEFPREKVLRLTEQQVG